MEFMLSLSTEMYDRDRVTELTNSLCFAHANYIENIIRNLILRFLAVF